MAKILSREEMTAYLKQAMELEASVYTQEKALAGATQALQRKTPVLSEARRRTVSKPSTPQTLPVNREDEKPNGLFLGIGILFLVLAIAMIAIGNIGLFILEAAFAVIFLFIALKAKAWKKEANDKNEAENATRRRQYEEALEKYTQDQKNAEAEYTLKQEQAQLRYAEDTQHYAVASDAVDLLRPPLKQTKDILESLYSLDVLFPKYRNLVAVSTIYEYFASGRVSALEGPDGAYNLYEAELRQNLIINKMDVIISKLEDIKANQYALYNELKQTNTILSGIAADVSELVSTTHEIADASRITAYCSQVTAQNTEALKYIALVSG